MAPALRFSLLLAFATFAAACSGDDDKQLFTSSGTGTGTGAGGGGTGGAGGAGGCPEGYADCDGDPINGCEIQTTADQVNCGGCGAVCLEGSCASGDCVGITLLAAEQGAPNFLAVDEQNLYWTTVVDEVTGAGAVRQMGKHGGAVLDLATEQRLPFAMVVDASTVRWTSLNDAGIHQVPIGGGATTTLVEDTEVGANYSLAIGAQSIYWTRTRNNDPATSGVVRAPLAGGDPTLIVADQQRPYSLAVDAEALYWTDRDAGMVLKAPLAGGAPEPLAEAQMDPFSIALQGDYVYWTNNGCAGMAECVMRARKDGSTPAEAIAGGQSGPYGLAVDDTHVYWTASGTATVMRAPIEGGEEPQKLAEAQPTPLRMAIDDTYVYWSTEGNGQTGDIRKLHK